MKLVRFIKAKDEKSVTQHTKGEMWGNKCSIIISQIIWIHIFSFHLPSI